MSQPDHVDGSGDSRIIRRCTKKRISQTAEDDGQLEDRTHNGSYVGAEGLTGQGGQVIRITVGALMIINVWITQVWRQKI